MLQELADSCEQLAAESRSVTAESVDEFLAECSEKSKSWEDVDKVSDFLDAAVSICQEVTIKALLASLAVMPMTPKQDEATQRKLAEMAQDRMERSTERYMQGMKGRPLNLRPPFEM